MTLKQMQVLFTFALYSHKKIGQTQAQSNFSLGRMTASTQAISRRPKLRKKEAYESDKDTVIMLFHLALSFLEVEVTVFNARRWHRRKRQSSLQPLVMALKWCWWASNPVYHRCSGCKQCATISSLTSLIPMRLILCPPFTSKSFLSMAFL